MNRKQLARYFQDLFGLWYDSCEDIVQQLCYEIVDCEGDMERITEVLAQYLLTPTMVQVSII